MDIEVCYTNDALQAACTKYVDARKFILKFLSNLDLINSPSIENLEKTAKCKTEYHDGKPSGAELIFTMSEHIHLHMKIGFSLSKCTVGVRPILIATPKRVICSLPGTSIECPFVLSDTLGFSDKDIVTLKDAIKHAESDISYRDMFVRKVEEQLDINYGDERSFERAVLQYCDTDLYKVLSKMYDGGNLNNLTVCTYKEDDYDAVEFCIVVRSGEPNLKTKYARQELKLIRYSSTNWCMKLNTVISEYNVITENCANIGDVFSQNYSVQIVEKTIHDFSRELVRCINTKIIPVLAAIHNPFVNRCLNLEWQNV